MKTRHMRFLKALAEERDPQKLQRKFLSLFLEFQNVERGSIWISRGTSYHCIEAAGDESEKIRGMVLNRDRASLVGWVIENGQMTVAEPGRDERHFSTAEESLDVKSTLILSFPLHLSKDKVYGAVQLIDTSAGGDRLNLDPEYLATLQELADIGAISLNSALEIEAQLRKNRLLRGVLDEIRHEDSLVGASPAFQETMKLVRGYAATDYPVIISGESGTGKDVLAREIHRLSRRADRAFMAQNCSAIPGALLESELFGYTRGAFTGAVKNAMGLFESANRGTVFLDEIGEMEVGLQAKLLRVLENNEIKPLGGAASKTVDVRVISATNLDIEQAVMNGGFRRDLYYRLNVLPLRVPPLRERKDDIPLLARYFLKRETLQAGHGPAEFSSGALEIMMGYEWPGNVRELENLIKKLMVVVSGPVVDTGRLAAELGNGPDREFLPVRQLHEPAPEPDVAAGSGSLEAVKSHMAGMTWEDMERTYIMSLLESRRWNVSGAARAAGVNRSTFDSRMKRLGIHKSG